MVNLPDDILTQVFNLAAEFKVYDYECWKEQLVLLSVCRRWRQCALPLVCQCAGFDFKRPDEGDVDIVSMEDCFSTNFDKVMAIGHPNLVRHLYIHISCNMNVCVCIIFVLNSMDVQLSVWKNLRTMCIEVVSNSQNVDTTVNNVFTITQTSNTIVDKMARMMPNIVNLELQKYSNNHVANILYGKLANLYANNLKSLATRREIPLVDVNAFSRLTNLQIGCENNSSIILPLAHIDTLESLILHNLPDSLQWYKFACDQSDKLVFYNLRKLDLEYSQSSGSSALSAKAVDTPKLHFPKLKCLTIVNPSEHQPLLLHSVFSSELEVLDMFTRMESLNCLTRIKLPTIKQLKLHAIFINHGGLGNALDVLSNVAKVAQNIDNLCLTINNEAPMDLTGCNIYPPLTSLDIYNIGNYEEVFSLVQRLPQLEKLTLHEVDTDNINNDNISALLGNQNGVAPISSSVEYVSVNYSERFTLQTAIRFTSLLLVGLSNLKELYAWQIDPSILLNIINKRKMRYPHLENVQVFDLDIHL